MTKIAITGMLVGPDYDDPFLHREISNGVFCPSSLILRQMEEANGDDLEIHINSEGGDVFAFNEVANRIHSYPASVKLIIGSCAFSEAANLALTCGRPIYIHPNSVMLWHSAMSTVYDGAAGELRSEATILEKINTPVKQALKAHGIPEEQVEEGFKDRNALVLGADELVKYGIATLLDDEAPSAPKVDEATSIRLAALAEANQRIAALYHGIHSVNMTKAMKKSEEEIILTEEEKKIEETPATSEEKREETPCAEDEPSTEEKKPEEEEQPVAEDGDEEQKPEEEEQKEEESTDPEAEDEEKPDLAEILDGLETLKNTIETIDGRVKSLEEKLAEKEVELEDAKKALKAERTKRIGSIAAAVSGKNVESRPTDWPAAIKACKGDRMAAYKKYPDLCKAWTKTN